MEILVERVGVNGPHGPLLRPTSLRVVPGEVTLVAGEPGAGHTALALAIAGRIAPSTGRVLVDKKPQDALLRRRVAVVDAPGVTEPDLALTLATVVGEELDMAGAPAGRKAVADWLVHHGAADFADRRFEAVPGALRTALLTGLAAARRGITTLVLDCPDRHGDDHHSWWDLAARQAGLGRGVVVLCTESSARLLGLNAIKLGQLEMAA